MKSQSHLSTDPDVAVEPNNAITNGETNAKKPDLDSGWRYWIVNIALSVTAFLPAMEGTVESTALPTIVQDLRGGELYVWVVNSYFLTSTALKPLYGQTANTFGRRALLLFAITFFILGSGIGGGTTSMNVLVAGRTIQGIGGGGVTMLVDLIVCDLVPLRKRGSVMRIMFGAVTIGTALGPFIGGIIVEGTSWRWVVYLNIPIGATALVLLLAFLHVKYEMETALMARLKRIDFADNAIFISATIAILIALTEGGTRTPGSRGA